MMFSRLPFTTHVIRDFPVLQRLSSDWDNLWTRCPGATPFQRPEWVLAWTQTFQPQHLVVIEVRCGDILVGLAPLFLYHAGEERVLAPLAASVSDYLDWLVDPSASSEILATIFEMLQSTGTPWHRLDLTDLPPTSPLLQFDFEDWDCQRSEETACPVLTLPSSASSVEDLLAAKPRHNLRTARRRTERLGKAQIEVATQSTLEEFLTAMMTLHSSRWGDCGASGMLAEDRVREFHRRAAPALLERNVLRLYAFRLNARLVATLYALAEEDTIYCYLQGFDPAYSALSPGAQILAAVIDDALRNGKSKVDFLRGREAYKYTWGAQDRRTYRLCLRHPAHARRPAYPPLAG